MENLRGAGLIFDYRYIGVFIIFLLYSTGCASIIPGRSMLIFLGILCSRGFFDFRSSSVVAILGALIGANIGYNIGRQTIGRVIERKDKFLFIPRDRLEKGSKLMRKHGSKLIIPAMFIGGFWAFTSLIPGMIRMNYHKFALTNAVGLVIWTFTLMGLGYYGNKAWTEIAMNRSYLLAIPVIIVLTIYVIAMRFIRRLI